MADKERPKDLHERMYEEYPDQEKPDAGPENRFDVFLILVSLFVMASIFFGLNSVLPGEGVARNALVVFLSFMGGALSFQANKAIFHTASKLVAAGDGVALALAVGWFALMSTVVATIGFAGISHELVEAARMREPLQIITKASRRSGEQRAGADRIAPLISKGKNDIEAITACEIAVGCVSGRRGRGKTVGELRSISRSIDGVEKLYERAKRDGANLGNRIERLAAKYEEQLSRGGGTGRNRAALLAIYSEAQSLVTQVGSTAPTAAARGLVGQLRNMIFTPHKGGRIDVGARVRAFSDELDTALSSVARDEIDWPPFPEPSGIAVGYQRMDLSWPLALLIFGLEFILIVLWAVMVRDFIIHRNAVRSARQAPSTDGGDSELRSGSYVRRSSRPADGQQPGQRNGDAS